MKGINMTRKIRTYTEEFKQECVTLALKAESISQTAKDLGIPEGTLYGWVKSITQNANLPLTKEKQLDLHEELKQLRKENARLKEDREILKKAVS
jgi:transposase